MARVETGVVQFDDDWPGLFIRGDNAFAYRMALDSLVLAGSDSMAKMIVKGLRDLLASAEVGKHEDKNVQHLRRVKADGKVL